MKNIFFDDFVKFCGFNNSFDHKFTFWFAIAIGPLNQTGTPVWPLSYRFDLDHWPLAFSNTRNNSNGNNLASSMFHFPPVIKRKGCDHTWRFTSYFHHRPKALSTPFNVVEFSWHFWCLLFGSYCLLQRLRLFSKEKSINSLSQFHC